MSESLQATFLGCLQDVVRSPSQAADLLLAGACTGLGAPAGRVLMMSAETGLLEVVAARVPAHDSGRTRLPAYVPTQSADYPLKLESSTYQDATFFMVPVLQDGTVVASLEILTAHPQDDDREFLATIASLLPLVRSSLTFRAGLQLVPPIPDVSGDELSFRRRVFEYLDSHTRAALVSMYVVDTDLDVSLIFAPPQRELRSFLESGAMHELLREAALDHEQLIHVEHDVAAQTGVGIGSYVVIACPSAPREAPQPEEIGASYVLLVGYPINYAPSDAEIAVLRHLLALAAYLHQVYEYLHEIADRVGHVAEIGSAITGLEVSQKARHDAKNQIELAQHLIAQVGDRPTRSAELLEELGLVLRRVADDLDEMKRATRAPERDKVPTSLREMWDSACGQVRWRMNQRRVRMHYDGPDVQVVAAPDWFRQVFLNLLLNSADAFDAAERRSGRIVLKINPLSPDAASVTMTYSDDATGILPQHFLACDVAQELDLSERIFIPGVTSKAGGSGWGLYVCRSIIRAHRGSIDLERAKSGTVFSISIPTAGASA
jgi:signal transduction histidine kinase